MGNTNTSAKYDKYYDKYYEKTYTNINEANIKLIRKLYAVVDVDYLDRNHIYYKMLNNEYFNNNTEKKKIIYDILDFYLHAKYINIYKKTDYLCNEKEKICICNNHAEDFRKIYDGKNYEPNVKYISWCEKYNIK